MKCLTLTQPYATLVSLGMKKIETRSWSTSYRGPLAIHAAKGLGPAGGLDGLCDLVGTEPFLSALGDLVRAGELAAGVSYARPDWIVTDRIPRGAIVAVCELVDCVTTDYVKNLKIIRRNRGLSSEYEWLWTANEKSFGDYGSGRFAWLLADIRVLPEPIPARGMPGLWKWDAYPDVP